VLFTRCRTQLSRYKAPQSIYVVQELPRTASGKIQRHVLVGASNRR
jgi:polyene macrolide polyketide synthase